MSLIARSPALLNSVVLLTADALLGLAAFYSSLYLRFGGLREGIVRYELPGVTVAVFIIVIMFSSFFVELYNQDRSFGRKETALRVISGCCLSFMILSALYYMMPSIKLWRGMLAYSLILFCIGQSLWHVVHTVLPRFPVFVKRVLVLGTGPSAGRIGNLIHATNHNHVLSGYIMCAQEPCTVPAISIVSNGDGSILETARKKRAHKIVVSLSERRGNLPIRDILNCKLSGIDVLDAPSFYEQMTGKLLIEEMRPSSLIFSDGFKITPVRIFFKRVFDILLSSLGLVVALPLFPLIAAIIKVDSHGPVFFRQLRVGKGERSFALYKFRTMRCDAEKETGAVWAQKNDCRVTRVGKVLRKTRLDEIPQLFNVLKGNMSFIGPRPERPEFVEQLKELIPYYSERHFIKPGISGWAQIKYPYGASVEDAIEKLRYDLYYIKHLSPLLDLLIVLETVKVVLFGRGGR